MKIISLGAGVQSSTLFLMSCYGDIEKADAAIFADTQDEPQSVYKYLDWLEGEGAKHGIPVYRVTAGKISDDLIAHREGKHKRGASLPFFLAWEDGKPGGMMRRQCTQDYKLAPIRRKTRELMTEYGSKTAEMMIGISTDEIQRTRNSGVKYLTNRYPLIEMRMSRIDCLAWYQSKNYPTPPRSACVFCPYHHDKEWARLKRDEPEAFADAVKFDTEIRELPNIKGTCYLHRSLKPLSDINFDSPEDYGQGDFGFTGECEGMCGI